MIDYDHMWLLPPSPLPSSPLTGLMDCEDKRKRVKTKNWRGALSDNITTSAEKMDRIDTKYPSN